jgi:hypothetical protein
MHPTATVIVETPLGPLECSVRDRDGRLVSDGATLRVVSCNGVPRRIDVGAYDVIGVLLSLSPSQDLEGLSFSCSWINSAVAPGEPDNGEWVDAQYWEVGDWVLLIGTEDFDVLSGRLPHCGFREDDYPTLFLPSALEVRIPHVPSGQASTFHFVIAAGPGSNAEERFSAWAAADLRHEQLLAIAS